MKGPVLSNIFIMWSSENLADYYRLLLTTEKCMTQTGEELENREIKNLLDELVEWVVYNEI